MTTDTKLLRALLDAGTPGDWEVLGDNQGHPCGLEWTIEAPENASEEDDISGWIAGRHGGDGIATTGNPGDRADAELIVALHNAAADLIAAHDERDALKLELALLNRALELAEEGLKQACAFISSQNDTLIGAAK